jgi:serine/threonine kinase PknH
MGSQRSLPPSVAPVPSPIPTDESVSGSQLRAIAASDQPIVLNGLADRWAPQLSSKKPGLVDVLRLQLLDNDRWVHD